MRTRSRLVRRARSGWHGHKADFVHDGAAAIVERSDDDLVLMDVQMPDVDGVEATRRIRDRVAPARQPMWR